MKSLKGQFLVATPQLDDSNFRHAVILMFEHSEEGAAGIVINRPMDASISDIASQVLEEEFDWDKAIHLGGPVPGPLMILHTDADLADQEILPGVYSTVEAEKVRVMIRDRVEPSLIIANYAGWGPGQLESELKRNSWFCVPADSEQVFSDERHALWDVFVRQVRGRDLDTLLKIKEVPPDPSLN